MLGRKILIAALVMYAVAVGCVAWPSADKAAVTTVDPNLVPTTGLKPFTGVAIQLQRVDWVEEYKKTIDDIAADGADTVSLVVDARQENAASTKMYVDMRKTMTVPQMTDLITHAKSKHLRVILMPIVLLDSPRNEKEWRGTLEPTSWDDWFDSYREMIDHYARIARDTGVDVLVVGSELVSAQRPEHLDEWIKTIAEVRGIYKGLLTYSSNWDRYDAVPFWEHLDLMGMNSYWTLSNKPSNEITVDDLIKGPEGWNKYQKDVFAYSHKIHKPVILLEAGWCSLSNSAKDPWDYTQETLPTDNALQEKLYEAFFQAWWGKPDLAGFVLWEMHPGGDETGKGYTPKGKPAEDVMRAWLQRPRWDVATP
jgi:hypothetical protein